MLEINNDRNNEEIRKMLHRLADYELSGLTPDEVISFINTDKGRLASELKQATAERDAAIADIDLIMSDNDFDPCEVCEHYKKPGKCYNERIAYDDCGDSKTFCVDWKWRGMSGTGGKNEESEVRVGWKTALLITITTILALLPLFYAIINY